jgi:hypothetical protein
MSTNFDNIEKKIETLPPSQREVTLDTFVVNWVRFISIGWESWSMPWGSSLAESGTRQFVSGVWDKIKIGWEYVKVTFKTVMYFH